MELKIASLVDSLVYILWIFCIGAVSATLAPIEDKSPPKKMKNGMLSEDENMKKGLLSVTHSEECEEAAGFGINKDDSTVSITVVGASGDLAKKKIFPALFALYYEGCLPEVCMHRHCFSFLSFLLATLYMPTWASFRIVGLYMLECTFVKIREFFWLQHFTIFGYARSKMIDAELRNMVSRTLTCRIDQR